jgi:chemotaxis signal transduction protein
VRDLLLFDVGAERFALPLGDVAAVLDSVDVQRGAGLDVRGIGVLRAEDAFLTVYEPSLVLGVACAAAEPLLLLLAPGALTIGLLVDHAEAALAVPVDGLRDLSAMGGTDGVVVGALRPATQWVTLLDTESLVNALLDRRPAHAA